MLLNTKLYQRSNAIHRAYVVMLVTLAFALSCARDSYAQQPYDPTPPRLSLVEGAISFFRPGAHDWTPAQINTPLAPGDALYTGDRSTLEIQVGPRAFVRAPERTQLGIVNLEPDFLQIRVDSGMISLDLRSLAAGSRVEVDTPNAVLTIEQGGYYRAQVAGDVTRFTARRAGQALVTLANGGAFNLASSEELIVRGRSAASAQTYVAPELDSWDNWNYARTENELDAMSRRYLSPGTYGAADLDQYGTWRVVPEYGPVWLPSGLPSGWSPYSTGSWMYDPYYGWTWVDNSAWGWAPFHYGRWVYLNGFWAWAPGPVIARAAYAPALVAFMDIGRDVSARYGIGGPAVGWVPLAWGEPLYPCWGRPGFAGRPWWGGWGGPQSARSDEHRNARAPNALLVLDANRFGRGPGRPVRFALSDADRPHVRALTGAPAVRPQPPSFAAGSGRGVRPPDGGAQRPALGTRPPAAIVVPNPQVALPAAGAAEVRVPQSGAVPQQRAGGAERRAGMAAAPVIVVPHQAQPKDPAAALPRAPFGSGAERSRPSPSPRYSDMSRAPQAPSSQIVVPGGGRVGPAQHAPQVGALPGRPANETAPRVAGPQPGGHGPRIVVPGGAPIPSAPQAPAASSGVEGQRIIVPGR